MENKQIADNIKKLCEEKGITQTQLGKELNFSPSFLSEMKTKNRTPSIRRIIEIAEYFEVSIDYLIGRKKEETKGSIIKSVADNGATQQIINNNEQLQPLEQEMLKEFRKLSRKEQLKEIDRLITDEN